MERFDESLLLLKNVLGLSTIFYDRRNVNPHGTKVDDLPQPTLDLIEEHNRLDRELHTRAMGLLEERIQAAGQPFKSKLHTFRKVNERFQRIADKLLQHTDEHFKDIVPKA